MPQAQTVELPRRFPLVIDPENRSSSTAKDARLVNGYMEKTTDGYRLFKRPGTLLSTQPSGGAATGRGIYNWKGNIYAIVGTTLYKDLVSKGTVDGTGGVYRFSSVSGGTPKLVMGNGVSAYTYDDVNGLVKITDANFPTSFYKGWTYLDKTLYVMYSPNNIKGSALDDAQTWSALNLINAQIEADTGIGLDKQLAYVVAFKQWNTELFYDAVNATGSPLSPVQGAKINYGCVSIETVQNIDGTLLWVGVSPQQGTKGSSVQVISMTDLRPVPISVPSVERLLDGADYTNVFSWTLKIGGHSFYGLTLKAAADNFTLVYDLRERLWSQWTDTSGNYFPIVSMTAGASQARLGQHETNGNIYLLDSSYNNDDSSLFTVDVYTPNTDLGTRRRKNLAMLEFVADQQTGSVLQVRKSDDDYQTWSNFRTVDLGNKKPFLSNCGSFIKRAYNLRHRANTALRLEAIEMQIDVGTL